MLSLANSIMQNRRNAILLALLFSAIPLMGWVADIIMALVTLRKGAKEGSIILMWTLLPSLLLAFKGYPHFLLYNACAGSVLTYVLALVLRHSAAWGQVLQAAVLIGIAEIAAVYGLLPHLDSVWGRELLSYFELLRQQLLLQTAASDIQPLAVVLSKVITGLEIGVLFIYDLLILLVARTLQARLYNPTGLRPELYNIKLGQVSVAVFFLVLLGCLYNNIIALNCLFLTLVPFIVSGISLTHCLASIKNISGYWFIGFYGLLILFFPYCALLLSVFALVDNRVNFRQRFKVKN